MSGIINRLAHRSASRPASARVRRARWRPRLEELEGYLLLSGLTFTVTNTLDGGDGSLRWAIERADAEPGADAIDFAIAPGGAQAIALASALPAITGPVALDATTQGGFAGKPLITVLGSGAGAGADGLRVESGGSGSTIRGLVLDGFGGAGLHLAGTGGVHVEGNYIGTDAAGAATVPNRLDGVALSASGVVVGGTAAGAGNVISGNGGNGVSITGLSPRNERVEGNRIGTDATGAKPLGNALDGVLLGGGRTTPSGIGPGRSPAAT